MAKFDKLGEEGAGEGGFSPLALPEGRGWDGEAGSWPGGLCVPVLAAVPSLREQGVLGLECWVVSCVGVTRRGEERRSQVLYVLISAAATALPHCHGKFGWKTGPGDGERGSKWGRRGCEEHLHLP